MFKACANVDKVICFTSIADDVELELRNNKHEGKVSRHRVPQWNLSLPQATRHVRVNKAKGLQCWTENQGQLHFSI